MPTKATRCVTCGHDVLAHTTCCGMTWCAGAKWDRDCRCCRFVYPDAKLIVKEE